MANTSEKRASGIKEKIKKFFRKISNNKDSVKVNVSKRHSDYNTSSQHLNRDDLKMY